MMASEINSQFGSSVQMCFNEVPKDWAMSDAYCQLIPDNDDNNPCYQMIPRIGAFEVSYKGIVVFSKLMTRVWPHVPSVGK
jgi:hypothetical protein